ESQRRQRSAVLRHGFILALIEKTTLRALLRQEPGHGLIHALLHGGTDGRGVLRGDGVMREDQAHTPNGQPRPISKAPTPKAPVSSSGHGLLVSGLGLPRRMCSVAPAS